MMLLLLLFLTGCLTACNGQAAIQSDELYNVRPWPETPAKPRMQSDVGEYIADGKAAYDSCTVAIGLARPEPDQRP